MPSARALLVASLLTEPPCGCLGPSGNDRYRERSEKVGLRNSTAKSRGALSLGKQKKREGKIKALALRSV